jgi:hypothetical protein
MSVARTHYGSKTGVASIKMNDEVSASPCSGTGSDLPIIHFVLLQRVFRPRWRPGLPTRRRTTANGAQHFARFPRSRCKLHFDRIRCSFVSLGTTRRKGRRWMSRTIRSTPPATRFAVVRILSTLLQTGAGSVRFAPAHPVALLVRPSTTKWRRSARRCRSRSSPSAQRCSTRTTTSEQYQRSLLFFLTLGLWLSSGRSCDVRALLDSICTTAAAG